MEPAKSIDGLIPLIIRVVRNKNDKQTRTEHNQVGSATNTAERENQVGKVDGFVEMVGSFRWPEHFVDPSLVGKRESRRRKVMSWIAGGS